MTGLPLATTVFPNPDLSTQEVSVVPELTVDPFPLGSLASNQRTHPGTDKGENGLNFIDIFLVYKKAFYKHNYIRVIVFRIKMNMSEDS